MSDASRFAGAVVLGDLDDFVAPSQACVNPIIANDIQRASERLDKDNYEQSSGVAKISLDSGIGSGILRSDAPALTTPDLIKATKGNTAQVSLSDCLACSGCVTSAETVLIQQQSLDEFLVNIRDRNKWKLIVVSISPQAIASIATHYNMTSIDTYSRLVTFFQDTLNVDLLVDTNIATDIALMEASREFIQRYGTSKTGTHSGETNIPSRASRPTKLVTRPVTLSVSSRRIKIVPTDDILQIGHQASRMNGDHTHDTNNGTSELETNASVDVPMPSSRTEITSDEAAQIPGIIVDIVSGRAVDISGDLVQVDFVHRTVHALEKRDGKDSTIVTPSQARVQAACEAAGLFDTSLTNAIPTDVHEASCNHRHLPLLASACPGWICYAEKTHPECLSLVSTVKSPQQIMGSLIKYMLDWSGCISTQEDFEVLPSMIYHVTIMPCFDKKLEASRKDFFSEEASFSARDVDCVLTTTEVIDLLIQENINLCEVAPAHLGTDQMSHIQFNKDRAVPAHTERIPRAALQLYEQCKSDVNDGTDKITAGAIHQTGSVSLSIQPICKIGQMLRSVPASGDAMIGAIQTRGESGGYLEYILKTAGSQLFNTNIHESNIEVKQVRNPDFEEVCLVVDGDIKLKFAKAYGFRNIQSIITKLKRSRCPFDYVEMMACPSGCVNGGGQISASKVGKQSSDDTEMKLSEDSVQDTISNVKQRMLDERTIVTPQMRPVVQALYGLHNGNVDRLQTLPIIPAFHTHYHTVPKVKNSLSIKW